MSKFLRLAAVFSIVASSAAGETFDLGRAATEDEIQAWDIDVRPDGAGLPEGSGDVTTGEAIYAERCAECHGDFGEGIGRWPAVAGGQGSLGKARPVRTIGSYWPYLSTVWDYVHRAMPYGNAQSLTADETYAVTAYLLFLNDLVAEDFVLSRGNFTAVRLPNETNFSDDDRAATEIPAFSADPCMMACKASVAITMRATALDVTPESSGAGPAPSAAPVARRSGDDPDPADVAKDGDRETGEYLSGECRTCHQAGGLDQGIPSIVRWAEDDFVSAMLDYKNGRRQHPDMNMIAGRLNDREIAALAAYFAMLDE